jgi:hypothetical protein
MKRRFALGGTVLGLLYGVGIMLWALVKGPGAPGWAEILGELVIVSVLGLGGAIAGLLLGTLVSVISRRR